MAHRVHPKIFRITKLRDWNSRWFDAKKFSQNLEEDFIIRDFLNKKLEKANVAKIEIEKFPNKLNIIIWTARPALIIGRAGTGVEELRKKINNLLTSKFFKKNKQKEKELKKREIKIEIIEVKNPWLSAKLASQWVSQQIEKRVGHKKVLKQTVEKIMSQKEVKGCRVELSGRLDGVEIARREWLKRGQLPRQTLRSNIDFSQSTAFCTYGTIGIKVWIYQGEKKENE